MPDYRTRIAHGLGGAEALERARAYSERARSFSDLQGSWSGNVLTFSASVQGLRLRGTVRVEDDALHLDARLPLIALPFAGWIPRLLRLALEQPVGSAASADSAPAREQPAAGPVVLYLHIPKAGGSTLGEYVFNQCRAEDGSDEGLLNSGVLYLPYGFFKEEDPTTPSYIRPLLRRADLRAVLGHFSYGIHEQVSRPSVYVTLLRDPVERVASLYYYLRLQDRMTLEEFALTPPFKEVDNDQTRRIAGSDPEVGQCTPALLRTAKEHLREHFAVVGVTERFDETVVLMKPRLGWTGQVGSYPKNVNPARPATGSLPAAAVAAIRRRNQLDCELHAYATDLLEEAIRAQGRAFDVEMKEYRRLRSAAP